MTLMRVRSAAQVTLPAEVRKALKIKEGDYLEAEIVAGGVLLKPVSVVARNRAWERIRAAVAQVRDLKPVSNENVAAEEEVSGANMRRVVIDATVLISAFLKAQSGGVSFDLLSSCEEGHFELCLSDEILAETADVLLSRPTSVGAIDTRTRRFRSSARVSRP